jgi:hypothetical protein
LITGTFGWVTGKVNPLPVTVFVIVPIGAGTPRGVTRIVFETPWNVSVIVAPLFVSVIELPVEWHEPTVYGHQEQLNVPVVE